MSDDASAEPSKRWPGDTVERFDPVGFAVAFTRAMRKQKAIRWVPSLRTAVAIPRLLAARWLRTRELAPKDYAEAALMCTPVEDRAIAEAVAHSLLFPASERKDAPAALVPVSDSEDEQQAASPAGSDDPLASIAADLASLDIDLGALGDLTDIDAFLARPPLAAEDGPQDNSAFDLFERLYSSADPGDRGLGELIHAFGGPAELEASGIRDRLLARAWTASQLLSRVGELEPAWIGHGVAAGYGPDLRRSCTAPWELAGVLAAEGDARLDSLLDDILQGGTTRELGRTLAFLGPHAAAAARREAFATEALARALDLTDLAELAVGLGEWIDPPEDLIVASVASNPRRAIEAAAWLEQQFGIDLRPELFRRWLQMVPRPDLGLLSVVVVDCPEWAKAVKKAVPIEARRLDGCSPHAPLDRRWTDAVQLAGNLRELGLPAGVAAASKLATEAMVRCPAAPPFLPLLDAFLGRRVAPDSIDRVLTRSRALGIPDHEIYDRIGGALEQLQEMVLADAHDADRYRSLIQRISQLPPELMKRLCEAAARHGNLEAMAALLAIDMGAASALLPASLAGQAVGYKGIGGGRNLLVQWFNHRHALPSALREQIKAHVKAALLDEAFDWMGKGEGSGEKGLVPQNRSRPFQAGDELDLLDLEETLDAIVSSGKAMDQVTEEDLYAQERVRGKAALCVLVDISGSMGGGELAVCAIAIVMLLGRLVPEEVALAAFESNTHTIKDFADDIDLDLVADQVLELAATGGTRVDAALRWATDQLSGAQEADLRVLFLLSDYCFFEDDKALRGQSTVLAEHGVRLLAASHGYVQQHTLDMMLETIGGEHLKLESLERLPAMLLAALADLKG